MHTTSLYEVVGVDGPFVSVFMDVGDHVELRWRAIRDQLEGAEAPPALLALVDSALESDGQPPRGLAGRALIAADDRVLIDRYLPVPPNGYTARYGKLPYLLPLVDLSEPLLPHVVVQVEPHGADLRGVDPSGRPVAVASVGARQRGLMDAGELADVAHEATALVDRLRAPLLVLAGPLSSRRSLRVALPNRYHHLVVEVEGSPDRAVLHLAGRANQDARRAVVERFRDESTRMTGRAVHGLHPVLSALGAGAVETLLLTDPLVGCREIGGERVDEVLPLRAVEAGADIALVGGAIRLHEDIGALLRP